MGYADRFYYGQCKVNVETRSASVSITDGEKTWTRTGGGELMVPGKNRYIVMAGDKRKEVFLGYGDYKTIEL